MSTASKIYGLDSLRFFAFLSVFLFHNTEAFKYGYLGIDFFFVLSSFLLTYLALNEIKDRNHFSKWNFFIRRSLRIYPLFFLVILFSFTILPFLGKLANYEVNLPENKYFYYLFLSNFDHSDHVFALRFLWSISVEEQFYILFLVLSVFFKRYFYFPVIGLFIIYLSYTSWASLNHWNTYYNSITYFVDFAAGMVLAKLYFNKSNYNIKALISLFILLLLIVYLVNGNETLGYFIKVPVAMLFAVIILLTVKIFDSHWKENKLFNVTEYLGKYTYGLYVFSGFVITFGLKYLRFNNSILNISVEFILLLAVTLVSYHVFEKPFLNLKKRFKASEEQSE